MKGGRWREGGGGRGRWREGAKVSTPLLASLPQEIKLKEETLLFK